MIPALPGLAAITGSLRGKWRVALVALAVIGFLVSAPTLVSFYERVYAEANDRGISNKQMMWHPEDSPLVHGWPAAMREISDAERQNVSTIFSQRGIPARTIADSRVLRVVAVWWWVLPLAHIPRLIGAAAALVLILTGSALLLCAVPRANELKRL